MKKISVISDAGSVKVGNDDCTILLPNGYGDGITEVYILEKDDPLPDKAKFFTTIEGNAIGIYDYDCGGEKVTIISGRYEYCYYNGCGYFKQI